MAQDSADSPYAPTEAATGCAPTGPADFINRDGILTLVNTAFSSRDPNYGRKKDEAWKRLLLCQERLDGQVGRSNSMHCATQVALETKWRINYSDNWPCVGRLLDRLEALVEIPDDTPLMQCDDGSWGICSDDFCQKLEPTVDALQTKASRDARLKPLAFLTRYADPAALLSFLYELQISDIAATGLNRRSELGAVQAAFSQIIFKDEIRALLAEKPLGFTITDRLEETYRDYLRQTQHPRTGFWGPWYRFEGRLLMVQDLSFTFHQVNYLSGNVDRWEALIDTTLAIRNLVYPAGWQPSKDKQFSNHNNYDVIQIFAFGWPHMRRDQKVAARGAIADMLAWCLGKSLSAGTFDGDVSVDGYYYGIRFLDRAGLWDFSRRFWGDGAATLPSAGAAHAIASVILVGFARVRDDSEESETIDEILQRSLRLTADAGDREPMA